MDFPEATNELFHGLTAIQAKMGEALTSLADAWGPVKGLIVSGEHDQNIIGDVRETLSILEGNLRVLLQAVRETRTKLDAHLDGTGS